MLNVVRFPAMRTAPAVSRDAIPTGNLNAAFDELKKVLKNEYGDRVELKLPSSITELRNTSRR